MKTLFTILLFLFCIIGSSQSDTLNRTGVDGRKYGYWIYYGKDKPERGYAADDIYEHGSYENGRKKGKWTEYYPGNKLKLEINFLNGRPDGKFIVYHENGTIEETGSWKNNHYIDNYFRYYSNGKIEHQVFFNEGGKSQGWQNWYYPSGDLALKYYTNNGYEVLDSGITGTKQVETIHYAENKIYPVLSNESLCLCNIREVLYPYITLDENGDSIVAYSTSYYFIKLIGNFKSSRLNKGTCYIEIGGEEVKLYTHEVENGRLKNGTSVATEMKAAVEVNYTKYFNSDKQIEFDGYYKDGQFYEGKQYIYNENGLLKQIKVYKEAKHVGDAPLN
jgi:antitoxin component YwqK of YwqJK toxin-antitoxin module